MSKRFPVPEFAREELKNLDWTPPTALDAGAGESLAARAAAGDLSACGGYPLAAPQALLDKLAFRGPNCCVVMCLTPPGREAALIGRSYAWTLQRAALVDSLDPDGCKLIVDWRTPRPMNTRLGPDNGVAIPGGVAYALLGHRYADHWIGNRVRIDNDYGIAPGAPGFRILSAYDDQSNDFHACNLTFSWSV